MVHIFSFHKQDSVGMGYQFVLMMHSSTVMNGVGLCQLIYTKDN